MTRPRRPVGSLVLVLLSTSAAAAPWETVRRGVIDPLNTAIHRHLPQAIKARNLDGILENYATDVGTGLGWDGATPVYTQAEEETLRWQGPSTSESIAERYRRLLDLFRTVDKAEVRIDRVAWTAADAGGFPATARMIVRGIRADGARVQLEQQLGLHVAERGGHWRITAEDVVARRLVARAVPRFVAATEAAGIANVHTNATSPPYHLFGGTESPVRASSGSAVADVDRDGCEDVFLAGSPDAVLYRNRCDGTFEDVTAYAGIPHPYPAAATGAVFFDYDNDGWPDLYVTAVAGGDRLFRNTGGGRFEDVTSAAHVPAGRWASMATVADYDRDGFLDLYVVRMGDHEHGAPKPNYDARNGVPGTLLHNEGDGTFSDVTAQAGVGFTGWDLAGAWGDYDGDGWPDLYVGNEFGTNVLYRNEHDGTFSDRTDEAGVADGGAAMGVAWGDYDGDGRLDLYVSNMHANSGWALFHPDFPAPIPRVFQLLGRFNPEVRRRADAYVDRLTRGSTLFHNNGDGTFTDVSDAAGVRDAQWGWSAEFVDYDDDGRLDLYSVNGFVSGPILDDV